MRKLKVTLLPFLAVLAASVASSPAANAAEGTFVVSAGSTSFTAVQVGTETLTLPNGRTLTCGTMSFSGTVANGAKSLSATQTWDNCHTLAPPVTLLPTTVEITDCSYQFTDLTEASTNTYAAKTAVSCINEQAIHVKLYANAANHTAGTRLCEYTIAPQSGLSGVHVTDNANGTLTVRWTNVTLAVTRTFGTVTNCGGAATVSTLNGETLLTAASGTIDVDD